ncbi:tRNA uracil 4-sulfurtransferase ThiI [Streptomonospora wellingtoniae]|uniref:Probable tRNA sulfurtransferase n=1 Tax=Streptomonospora wellingtoniae TaxID=3075544 RepID=A0ABU2KP83_9ACTN|nr:tRNA uracil 4-sulfurtransferase ThiI [Streptomonospora sp. DSM 45055]MDT0301074.1 tRNA uracil 4-sulfurtransferase ThiI [Streptomonospora sp. DSM 45055]
MAVMSEPEALEGREAQAAVQERSASGPHELCVLMKLGEIVLKGSNRSLFERRLHNNIRASARGLSPIKLTRRGSGVVIVRMPGASDIEVAELAERMRNVMGVVWVHLVRRVPKDLDAVTATAVQALADRSGSFAVRARRRDKRFPLTSSQLAGHVGAAVQQAHGLPVDLKHPQNPVSIEVDKDEVFVFTDGIPGQGGLPVGMSGRALVLMSGGIDSPIAAHRMMRRGLKVDFLHFSGMPFTGPESIYKAYSLVRQLDRYQVGSRLFVVPFGKAQQQLKSSGAERLQIIAQRRLMLKTAEALADDLKAEALVTGDALGQVSSQTMANLTALDDSVDLPILRPLIGMDKTEIMDQARRIGTLSISELPDEDCCTLLTPRQVETAAKIPDLRQIEKRLDAEELAEHLLTVKQLHRPSFLGDAAPAKV